VLGCAGLLGAGSLVATAFAGQSVSPGLPGTVTIPDTSAARQPAFAVAGRTGTAKSGKAAAFTSSAAADAAAQRTDFNGDGSGDVLYRISSGDVYADFGATSTLAIPSDQSEIKDLLLPGDVTGDSHPDLLTLTASGSLRLHSGANATTDGGMAPYITLSSGWRIYNKVFAPGDLNGDSYPDLLARSTAGLFRFSGTGNPAAPFSQAVKVGGTGWSQFDELVGADDLNGDGLADVIARNATGLYLYPGGGSASSPFKTRVQIGGTGWSQYNQLVGGADYDGNGTADLLARGYDGTLYFYSGKGNGTFAARSTIGSGWGSVTQFAGAGNPPHFGKSGVFARTSGGDLYYYGGTGTGKLTAKNLIGTGWSRSLLHLTHATSLRADGLSDLIAHNTSDGHLYNTASYAESDPEIAGGSKSYNLVVGPGDLNGDGKGDLLARSSTALYFYAGNGDGLSVQGRVQIGGSGWQQFNKIVGSGDLTGDGRADLIARNSSGLYLYPGTGSASAPFTTKVKIGSSDWSQYTNIAAPGDIDGNGIADLLASNSAGQLYFYSGTGRASAPFKTKVKIGSSGWAQYADLL
jgi:hypothetical protein